MVVRAVASELKLDVVECGPSVAEARSIEERHLSFHMPSCPIDLELNVETLSYY
jgi:hypothetical protein